MKGDIEITSAMLKAGLAALVEWRSAPLGIGFPAAIKKIYTAMALANGETLEEKPEPNDTVRIVGHAIREELRRQKIHTDSFGHGFHIDAVHPIDWDEVSRAAINAAKAL